MMGTFGGALEARQIDASDGKLTADVSGEVETEDNVLVIRRIHEAMRLVAPQEVKATVERVHGIYAMRCPLYRTFHKTLQLTSSFELVSRGADPRATSGSEPLKLLGTSRIALRVVRGAGKNRCYYIL